jgi:hypothetical protein
MLFPFVYRRRIQAPSRRPPPSVAARLAQKAPSRSEAVIQKASEAVALRVASTSALICVTTSLTRFVRVLLA